MSDLVISSWHGEIHVAIERQPKSTRKSEHFAKEEKRIPLRNADEKMDIDQLKRIYAKEIAEIQALVEKRAHSG